MCLCLVPAEQLAVLRCITNGNPAEGHSGSRRPCKASKGSCMEGRRSRGARNVLGGLQLHQSFHTASVPCALRLASCTLPRLPQYTTSTTSGPLLPRKGKTSNLKTVLTACHCSPPFVAATGESSTGLLPSCSAASSSAHLHGSTDSPEQGAHQCRRFSGMPATCNQYQLTCSMQRAPTPCEQPACPIPLCSVHAVAAMPWLLELAEEPARKPAASLHSRCSCKL